jgi:hypothetical protein
MNFYIRYTFKWTFRVIGLRLKYTRWRHFGLAGILKHQLSEIYIYIILKHFQNVLIYVNRLENAKTTLPKRQCTRWRHIGLAAIMKRKTSEILFFILRHFQNVFTFKNRSKTVKVIVQTKKNYYHTPSCF